MVAYYESKTSDILYRYGPGPRVHYHVGFIEDSSSSLERPSADELRRGLVAAQERMLSNAAGIWNAKSTFSGEVLDVGCGLGGGAIFWAQEFGARVTAITCVESHVDLVATFAKQAGVAYQVRPLLCDALDVPGEGCFDAAVAVDSSCHLARAEWFNRLSLLLRPSGHVFISDCFLVNPEYEEPFNRHWCAQIGSLDEYCAAAREAHFELDSMEDVSLQAVNFWTTTLALIRKEGLSPDLARVERAKLEESFRIHSLVRQGLREGGLRHLLLSFVGS